jgi:hypothetical protein
MRRWGSALLVMGLVACTTPAQTPGAHPSATAPEGGSFAEPSLNPDVPLPSGMVLPPIVDPDGAGAPYARDEPVQVDGLTIVYQGTSRADGRYVARFEVAGTLRSPPGALFFLPSGPSVRLEESDGHVTSEPFALRSPEPSTLFAWLIGAETLVWELGPIVAD